MDYRPRACICVCVCVLCRPVASVSLSIFYFLSIWLWHLCLSIWFTFNPHDVTLIRLTWFNFKCRGYWLIDLNFTLIGRISTLDSIAPSQRRWRGHIVIASFEQSIWNEHYSNNPPIIIKIVLKNNSKINKSTAHFHVNGIWPNQEQEDSIPINKTHIDTNHRK